jgi:hypothetical protein
MDIYSLKREEGPKTDEAVAFVVVAPTEHEARRLAAAAAGGEGAYPWAFEATLVKVGTAEPGIAAGVLLGSYTGGYE